MTLPISWGEIFPLSFIPSLHASEYVFLSHPLRRYNDSVAMIPELLALGRELVRVFDDGELASQRVLFLVSADLAHTHLSNGPYGYCPCAESFDQYCGKWVRTLNASYLIDGAAAEQSNGALSCGFVGFVTLQGMMDADQSKSSNSSALWTSELRANYHPTYYGMMVANLTRHVNTTQC